MIRFIKQCCLKEIPSRVFQQLTCQINLSIGVKTEFRYELRRTMLKNNLNPNLTKLKNNPIRCF